LNLDFHVNVLLVGREVLISKIFEVAADKDVVAYKLG